MATESGITSVKHLSSMEGLSWGQFLGQHDLDVPKVDDSPFTNGMECEIEKVSEESETMKLKIEDIKVFGIHPATDNFYLVVCEYCSQVVKAQALEKHIEQRHGHMTVLSNIETPPPSTNSEIMHVTPASTNGTEPSLLLSHLTGTDHSLAHGDVVGQREAEISVIEVNKPVSMAAGQTTVPIVTKIKDNSSGGSLLITKGTKRQASPTPGTSVKTSSDHDAKRAKSPGQPSAAGPGSTLSSLLSATQPTSSSPKATKVKKASASGGQGREKLLPCKDREYDPNKHCGVKTSELDKACTRSLTCKTHSLTLRRQVSGRSSKFDELLNEHRLIKEAALREQGKEVKMTKKQIKQKQAEAKKLAQLASNLSADSNSQSSLGSNSVAVTTITSSKGHIAPTQSSTSSNMAASLLIQQQLNQNLKMQQTNAILIPSASPGSGQASSNTMTSPSTVPSEPNSTSQLRAKNTFLNSLLSRPITVNISPNKDSLLGPPSCSSSLHSPSPVKAEPSVSQSLVTILKSSPATNSISSSSSDNTVLPMAASLITGTDGTIHLRMHPRPLAVNTFNGRTVQISPLRIGAAGTCVSSRVFDKRRLITYSKLRPLFHRKDGGESILVKPKANSIESA